MNILAISDCHYKFHQHNDEDAENSKLLVNFLKSVIGRFDLVVFAGDIFDLWFDWKYTIVKQYFPLLRIIAEIHDAGSKVIMISGNHDFWFGNFLPDYVGMEIHPDGFTIEADDLILRFEHGDTRTHNDLRYQMYRRIIRQGFVRRLFSLLHPDLALSLGTLLSRSSRNRSEDFETRKRKTRGLKLYAQSLVSKGKADIVVMGHSHQPELIKLVGGYYANCGDWISHHSYVEINAGKPSLHRYIDKQPMVG